MKEYDTESEIFKALSHPIRIKILMGLKHHNNCNVSLMAEKLQIPQSSVSQHLAMMKSRGIIYPKKDKVKTCYQIVNPLVLKILELIES